MIAFPTYRYVVALIESTAQASTSTHSVRCACEGPHASGIRAGIQGPLQTLARALGPISRSAREGLRASRQRLR